MLAGALASLGCGGQAGRTTSPGSTGAPAVASVSTAVALAKRAAPPSATPATPPTPATPTTGAPAPSVPRPTIHRWPIPYGSARRMQMAAYSLRHYHEDTYLLSHPRVIVEHYSETADA